MKSYQGLRVRATQVEDTAGKLAVPGSVVTSAHRHLRPGPPRRRGAPSLRAARFWSKQCISQNHEWLPSASVRTSGMKTMYAAMLAAVMQMNSR